MPDVSQKVSLLCGCDVFTTRDRPTCQSRATQEDLLCDPCRLLTQRQKMMDQGLIDRTGIHSSGLDDHHWHDLGHFVSGETWIETSLNLDHLDPLAREPGRGPSLWHS